MFRIITQTQTTVRGQTEGQLTSWKLSCSPYTAVGGGNYLSELKDGFEFHTSLSIIEVSLENSPTPLLQPNLPLLNGRKPTTSKPQLQRYAIHKPYNKTNKLEHGHRTRFWAWRPGMVQLSGRYYKLQQPPNFKQKILTSPQPRPHPVWVAVVASHRFSATRPRFPALNAKHCPKSAWCKVTWRSRDLVATVPGLRSLPSKYRFKPSCNWPMSHTWLWVLIGRILLRLTLNLNLPLDLQVGQLNHSYKRPEALLILAVLSKHRPPRGSKK